MIQTGLALDTDLELRFDDGDFKIEDSSNQEIQLLIKAQKGQFYQWPTTGFGIDSYRNASVNKDIIKSDLKQELQNDNFTVEEIVVGGDIDQLLISVTAERNK